MRLHPRCLSLSILASLSVLAPSAFAADGNDIFSFSGYGTVGVVHNSEHQADFSAPMAPDGAGHTDRWSTTPDSRLAAQVNANFTENFSAVVQAVSEYDSERSYAPDLTLAHVRYAFTPALAVRAGRIVAPTFMLSEYRRVGYAMPWVRPPAEVYNTAISLDGAELSYKFNVGESTAVTLQLVAGEADEQVFELHDTIGLLGRVEFGSSTVFAGYNETKLSLADDPQLEYLLSLYGPIAPELASSYHLKDNDVTFAALGYAYDPGKWFFRSEITRLAGEEGMLAHTTNMYASVGMRVGAFTPYATYGKVNVDSPITVGAADPIGVINGILANGNEARQSLTLGARWDVRESVALKLEASHVDSDAGSNGGLNNLQPGFRPGGSYNLVSASVDFVF